MSRNLQRAGASLVVLLALGSTPTVVRAQQAERPWWDGIETHPPGGTVLYADSFYTVSGDTPEAIRESIESRDLARRYEGRPMAGEHRYAWRTYYRWARSPRDRSQCDVSEFRVLAKSIIVLPQRRAASRPELENRLRRPWRTFLERLRHHEEGHRERLEAGVDALVEQMDGLARLPCEGLDARLRDIAEAALADVAEAQAAYDRETDHGVTQGAVWPPSVWPER